VDFIRFENRFFYITIMAVGLSLPAVKSQALKPCTERQPAKAKVAD
jgi:hypothetical protein